MTYKYRSTTLDDAAPHGVQPLDAVKANGAALARFVFENVTDASTVAASKFTLVKNLFTAVPAATLSPTAVVSNPDLLDHAYVNAAARNDWDAGRFLVANNNRMRVLNLGMNLSATHSWAMIATPRANSASHTWAGKFISSSDQYQINDPQPTTRKIGISWGTARSEVGYVLDIPQIFFFEVNFADNKIRCQNGLTAGTEATLAGTGATGATDFAIGARSTGGSAPANIDFHEIYALQFPVLSVGNISERNGLLRHAYEFWGIDTL